MLIDSHVHLNDPKLYNRLDEVIKAANTKQVKKMIVSGYDYQSSLLAIDIAKHYPNVYATIGIHPTEVNKFAEDNLQWIYEKAKDEKVVAIGEIGLDYYWDTSFKDKQILYFQSQLEIAKELNLPVVIHSRKAANDTYRCLQDKNNFGVMHCFSYSIEMAKKFIDIGFSLGIGGVVTFKNASLKSVVKEVALENIVTETDAPYLTPSPYRGEVNEPKYIDLIISEIAKIKNLEKDLVEKVIAENVKKIFKI